MVTDDSDGPDEFTNDQGFQQDRQFRKSQTENKRRFVQEGKERRRQQTLRNLQQKLEAKKGKWSVENEHMDVSKAEEHHKEQDKAPEFLPTNIVDLLAAREKKIFQSDSEDEKVAEMQILKEKRQRKSGSKTVILKEMRATPCTSNANDFLKKRHMSVARSNSILRNSKQALRLLSSTGLLR